MDRKWKASAIGAPPAAADNSSDGFPTGGNPGGGVPATKPGAYWYYMVTEELLALISYVGLALDKNVLTQVRDALLTLFDQRGIAPGGRVTAQTGVAVPAADVAGAATVFYTPHLHDRVQLYDGTRWKWYTFAELSQALNDAAKSPAAAVANTNYDMFVWDDAGTVRCTRGPTWNAGAVAGSDTARGTGANSTEIEFFQGRWVNKNAVTNGPAARRGLYVGTIRTDGASQVNDTKVKRHVWNTYNRARRDIKVTDATATWTYSLATFRQANNSAANQIDMVRGLNEDAVSVNAIAQANNSVSGGSNFGTGVGLDSTTTTSGLAGGGITTNVGMFTVASYDGLPGLGRHFLAWLERGAGSDVQNWNGGVQVGLNGSLFA